MKTTWWQVALMVGCIIFPLVVVYVLVPLLTFEMLQGEGIGRTQWGSVIALLFALVGSIAGAHSLWTILCRIVRQKFR